MKRRIIILYDFLSELGGLERVMFFQANSLSKYYDVELGFSYISDKNKFKITKELGLKKEIKTFQIGKIKNQILQFAISLLFPGRIRNLRADLILSHSFMASGMAYHKKIYDKTPYLVMIHHPPNFLYSDVVGWANNPGRLFAKLLGLFFRDFLIKKDIKYVKAADLVIVNSGYTARRVEEIYGVKPIVIYPPVSNFFKVISQKERSRFLKRKNINKPFLLGHGRIIPDKNYETLINLIKRFEDYDLIISGSISDSYKKKLLNLAKRNNVENRVKILGRISNEDLLGYYNCASLFLMPAKKEDFGLTPIEAMACGCPVVAWADKAGPQETVSIGASGYLAKAYDLNDFNSEVSKALNTKWDKRKITSSISRFSEIKIQKKLLQYINRI